MFIGAMVIQIHSICLGAESVSDWLERIQLEKKTQWPCHSEVQI